MTGPIGTQVVVVTGASSGIGLAARPERRGGGGLMMILNVMP